jgi:putative FmdB family regulatory protein
MPTYEYRCRSCHETFVVHERISQYQAGSVVCPKCRSREVERLMSGFYAKTPRKS